MSHLKDTIDIIDDQIDLFDGTPPKKQVKYDQRFGDAIGRAVKSLLFPYCLKSLFKGEK